MWNCATREHTMPRAAKPGAWWKTEGGPLALTFDKQDDLITHVEQIRSTTPTGPITDTDTLDTQATHQERRLTRHMTNINTVVLMHIHVFGMQLNELDDDTLHLVFTHIKWSEYTSLWNIIWRRKVCTRWKRLMTTSSLVFGPDLLTRGRWLKTQTDFDEARRISAHWRWTGVGYIALRPLNVNILGLLVLTKCLKLRNLDALVAVHSLPSLSIYNCPKLTDISAVATLSALTTVRINGCQALTTITALSLAPALKHITINYCKQVDVPYYNNLKLY